MTAAIPVTLKIPIWFDFIPNNLPLPSSTWCSLSQTVHLHSSCFQLFWSCRLE